MNFDGHFMKNGFKLFSTSHHRQFNHISAPEDLGYAPEYGVQVDNLALDDFRHMINYYNLTGYHTGKLTLKQWDIETSYMESQGNFVQY